MKNCRYCGEIIQDEAKKCRHCGEWLQVECSECHQWVDKKYTTCPNCGYPLKDNGTCVQKDTNVYIQSESGTSTSPNNKKNEKLENSISGIVGTIIFLLLGCCVAYFISKSREDNKIEQQTERLENEKRSQEELIKYENDVKHSIVLHNASVSSPDDDGNVTTYFDVENISTMTIKYITIKGFYINEFGDQTFDNSSQNKDYTWRLVGPISSKERQSFTFDNLIKNNSVKNISFSEIQVDYTNGNQISIKGNKYLKLICNW